MAERISQEEFDSHALARGVDALVGPELSTGENRQQAQDASWKLRTLVLSVRRAAHDSDCARRHIQTDESACSCWVLSYYQEIRQVLVECDANVSGFDH